MKKYIKPRYLLLFLLLALVVIQFFRPEPNNGSALGASDITHTVTVPDSVLTVLERACFDCHSDHTSYPWYAKVQPVSWWLDNHITEGKEELNFSSFSTYRKKRQIHKMEEIEELVKDREMPLNSYLWIHHEAKLTEEEISLICNWASEAKKTLENK